MININVTEYKGGTEIKILFSPLMKEVIRGAAALIGAGIILLIYCLL